AGDSSRGPTGLSATDGGSGGVGCRFSGVADAWFWPCAVGASSSPVAAEGSSTARRPAKTSHTPTAPIAADTISVVAMRPDIESAGGAVAPDGRTVDDAVSRSDRPLESPLL